VACKTIRTFFTFFTFFSKSKKHTLSIFELLHTFSRTLFAGNIILVTFECIGKIQWFFAKCDSSLDTHLGKRKNLIFNIVRQMAKNLWILPAHSNVTSKVGLTLAGPLCIKSWPLPKLLICVTSSPSSLTAAPAPHLWSLFPMCLRRHIYE